jgi:hypothetical protein
MQGWFDMHESINVVQHINRSKDKHLLIILEDEEKAFDKIQNHFMIKALKLGIEGMHLNIIKAMYDKPITNIIFSVGKTETISPEVRNKTRVPTLPTPILHNLGIPSQSSKARRRNERNTNR